MDTNELISSVSHRGDAVCLYSNQHVAFLYKSAVCGFFSCAACAVYWVILIVFPQRITMCLLSIATELRLSSLFSRTFPWLHDTGARTAILDTKNKGAEGDSTGTKCSHLRWFSFPLYGFSDPHAAQRPHTIQLDKVFFFWRTNVDQSSGSWRVQGDDVSC